MPTVVLYEQLGNQLFQWAAGYALGKRYGEKVRLITTNYGRRGTALTLRQFPVAAEFLNPWPGLICRRLLKCELYTLQRFSTVFGEVRPVTEPPMSASIYRPSFTSLPPNTLMNGLFQSARYFDHLREEIRQQLGVHSPEMLKLCPAQTLERIKVANSVSVHIRRTDYLSAGNREVFEVCNLAYFRKAMSRLRELLLNPTFFIFSDDINWAKAHLTGTDVHYVSSTQHRGSTVQDFVLMANCAHHIISNSTYSWWASFAGSDGEVLLPERWTNDGQSPIADKLLPTWTTVSLD
jgi:hypothetical protein